MLGSWTTPQLAANKFCVPWDASDPLIPLYQQAANQFNTDNDPSLAAMIFVALQNQMMLYAKAQCTDCATQGLPPTQTVILAGATGTQVAAPQGTVQINSTDQTESIIAGTVAKATSSIPVVGAVAAVIADITGIFTSAHANAVAEEQATNCAVAYAFNKYIPVYDAAVASGQMTAGAALAAVTQIIQQQLSPELDPVISAHNIGWAENQILMAHLWFRQQWYPTLATSSELSLGSLSNVVSSLTSGSPIVLIILSALAALLLL